MLKKYLNEKGISVYSLAKSAGIPYSTLNDLSNGKVDIDNCKLSLVKKLSSSLELSIEELCLICTGDDHIMRNPHRNDINIKVRNKSYYVDFRYGDELVEMKLCKVNENTTYYIDDIVKWRIDSYIRNRRLEEFR